MSLVIALSSLAGPAFASSCFVPAQSTSGSADVNLLCSDPDGSAKNCFFLPGGACGESSNTVTLSIDGTVVYKQTYGAPGKGYCTMIVGGDVTVQTLAAGLHQVVITESSPPRSRGYSIAVLPGPACDADADGIPNSTDNCSSAANADQLDTDADGAGDACDSDDDQDGCEDTIDEDPKRDSSVIGHRLVKQCVGASNEIYLSDSSDSDGDGTANCADPDDDGDGILDADDTCPAHHVSLGANYCNEKYPPLICDTEAINACLMGGCNTFQGEQVSLPDPSLIVRPHGAGKLAASAVEVAR